MGTPRTIIGTGEVFASGKSYGLADYDLAVFQTSRGKGADGTLKFHDDPGRGFIEHDLTIKLASGISFKLAVLRITNGRISVASNGPVPGV